MLPEDPLIGASISNVDLKATSHIASPTVTPTIKRVLSTSQRVTRVQSSPTESIIVPSTPDDFNETYVSPHIAEWPLKLSGTGGSPLNARRSFPPSQLPRTGSLSNTKSPTPEPFPPPNRPRSPSPSQRRYISSAFRRASFSSTPSTPSRASPKLRARSNPPTPIAILDDATPPRRALRQRTAIQIAPYTREALVYKATLVRAGAKEALVKDPKRVVGVAAQGEETGEAEEDSQGREWDEDASQFQPPDEDDSFRERPPVRKRTYVFDRKRPEPSPSPERARPKLQEKRRKSSPLKTVPPRGRAVAQPVPDDARPVNRFLELGGGVSYDDDDLPPLALDRRPQSPRQSFSPETTKRAADSLKNFVAALGGEITDDEDDPTPNPLPSKFIAKSNPARFPLRMRHRSPPQEVSLYEVLHPTIFVDVASSCLPATGPRGHYLTARRHPPQRRQCHRRSPRLFVVPGLRHQTRAMDVLKTLTCICL